jgi:hypothetical protein
VHPQWYHAEVSLNKTALGLEKTEEIEMIPRKKQD